MDIFTYTSIFRYIYKSKNYNFTKHLQKFETIERKIFDHLTLKTKSCFSIYTTTIHIAFTKFEHTFIPCIHS